MGELVLREATEADDAGIRVVIAAAFPGNPKRRAEITGWQYWRNPFGRTRVFVCEDDRRIVGSFAGFPMPAVVDGASTTIANGVDLAVDPSYRGQGLSARLAEALYSSTDVPATVSFINNPLAMRGTGRAGWRELGRLAVWVLPVNDRFLASRMHIPLIGARAVRRVVWRPRRGPDATIGPEVPAGIDGLWARSGGITSGVAHTQAWWDWRFGAHPDQPYTLLSVQAAGRLRGLGAAVVREAFGGRFVYLLDLVAETSDDARAITGAAASMALEQGAVGVALLALPGTRLATRAAEGGLRRVPARLDPKPTWFGTAGAAGIAAQGWSVSWCDLDNV